MTEKLGKVMSSASTRSVVVIALNNAMSSLKNKATLHIHADKN